MRATPIADTYSGKIKLCCVKQDPANKTMVTALVVHDTRPFSDSSRLHTGARVWIAAKQVTPC